MQDDSALQKSTDLTETENFEQMDPKKKKQQKVIKSVDKLI